MDIVEIIPLLIFALLYFFGSRKKKEEDVRKKGSKGPGMATADVPQKGLSLQQRLDQALQKMEQRIATESAAEGKSGKGSGEDIHLGPRERTEVDPDEYANEIQRMSAETLYNSEETGFRLESGGGDPDLLDGGVVKVPGHSGFSVRLDEAGRSRGGGKSNSGEIREDRFSEEGNQYDFRSLMTEVPNETYHGHGFSTFSEAHGLHWGETDPIMEEGPVAAQEVRRDFRSIAELRRAVIMAEILDRPVSRRPGIRYSR